MTGVLNAVISSVYFENLIVTVGTGLGSGFYVDTPNVGAISPNTFRGKSVTMVRSTGSSDLQVVIDDVSSLPQSFFTRLTIEDGSGVIRTYTSSSATFISGGVGGESWHWGNGSNRVFTSADDTEQHRITFYR